MQVIIMFCSKPVTMFTTLIKHNVWFIMYGNMNIILKLASYLMNVLIVPCFYISGNNDSDTKVVNWLPEEIRTRYFKLDPRSKHTVTSMRWGIIGRTC